MSRSKAPGLLGWFLASILALPAGCGTDTSGTSYGTSGSLSIDLELRGDTDIDEVLYRVSGNGIEPIEGVIDTSAPGTTYSLEVFGLAEAQDYQVEMMATTADKTTTCAGVAQFDVFENDITLVYLVLRCGRPEALGGVRVNASINYCAEIMTAVAAPLQTSVGNDIQVYVVANDWEGDMIEYFWSATGGAIANPTATSTTYTCTEVGNQSIAVRISDDGFDYCRDEKTFAVRCVDGGGPECESDDYCKDHEICASNKCVPDLGCIDHAQCKPGEICVQNMCVPAPPECEDDGGCIKGEVCENNECVPGCRHDGDCITGEICENNECVPAPLECEDDSGCIIPGEVCENNECVPGCRHNGQCNDGEMCLNNQCVPEFECLLTVHCPPDEICVRRKCVPAPPECTADWQCEAGESCIDEECVYTGANRCPYFFGAETAPLVQSMGNLINVWSQALDKDGDPMEVLAESTCGLVSVPLQSTDSAGKSETTVRCDFVGSCHILISVSDDDFTDCDGTTTLSGQVYTPVRCEQ